MSGARTVLRHLIAIAVLPFTVTVLVSAPHAVWAMAFIALNAIYLPLLEERALAVRFGEPYREYCRHVPRLMPRIHPWTPHEENRL